MKSKPKNKTKNVKTKITKKVNSQKKSQADSMNKLNTSINNVSINKSYIRKKSKIINKSKENSKSKEDSIKKEKKIQISNELIKKQYKIIKDFLTPILKEENARQLVSCYTKKITKKKSPILARNKNSSLNKRALLDYSFVNDNPNKIKIPLFQILFPKQYKRHFEKTQAKNKNLINRPCRQLSSPNFDIKNNQQVKKSSKSKQKNNNNLSAKQNNKYINKNNNMVKNIKSRNINNNKINSRTKTPPLYLRINDVQKQHNDEIEKLKKKYEYNYKNKNKNNNNSNFSLSDFESKSKSRNVTHSTYDFEKWYNYEKTWQKMRNIKLNIIKSEIEDNKEFMNKNDKDEETFKPKINKNSIIMANKKYDNDFYLRLKNYQNNKNKKMNMLQKKLEPNFKPYINTNYKIKNEYYDYMKYDQRLINRDFNFFLEEL